MNTSHLNKIVDAKRIEFIINGLAPSVWVLQFDRKKFDSLKKCRKPFLKESDKQSKQWLEIQDTVKKLSVSEENYLVFYKQAIVYILICREQ